MKSVRWISWWPGFPVSPFQLWALSLVWKMSVACFFMRSSECSRPPAFESPLASFFPFPRSGPSDLLWSTYLPSFLMIFVQKFFKSSNSEKSRPPEPGASCWKTSPASWTATAAAPARRSAGPWKRQATGCSWGRTTRGSSRRSRGRGSSSLGFWRLRPWGKLECLEYLLVQKRRDIK